MGAKKFSTGDAIRFGWDTTKKHLGFFIGLTLVAGAVYVIPSVIAELIRENNPLIAMVIDLVSSVVSLVMAMGIVKISLQFCDTRPSTIADLFSCFPLFFPYLFGTILYVLIFVGGILLLIVPGIIWGIQFQFFAYPIVEKGLGAVASLKQSSAITKGAKWDLFLFGLLLFGINILGALALGVGLFLTGPTSILAAAFVYRQLLSQTRVA